MCAQHYGVGSADVRVADPDPGVPAGGLRRRRRPRRVPGPGAAHARSTSTSTASAATAPDARRAYPTGRPRLAERQPRAADLSASTWRWRPASAAATCCTRTPGTRTWPGTSAKLLYGVPHVRHRALARAAATVEGRAARRRLPALVLGRAHGLRDRRRGHRGLRRHARRRPRQLPGRRPGEGARHPQRHRHRALPARPRDRRCSTGTASTRTAPSSSFVGRITRQKGVGHLLAAAHELRPGRASWCCCAGAPDTPEIAAETAAAVARPRRRARTGVVWIDEMLPRDEVTPGAHATRRCSSARRSTSRWAS